MEGTMEGPEAVQRATELIEQRLAQEEETEVGARVNEGCWGGGGGSRLRSPSVLSGREGLAAGNMLGRYRLGPGQAHFHTRMLLMGLWVVRDGASAPQTDTWGWGAGLPKTLPTHLGFGR